MVIDAKKLNRLDSLKTNCSKAREAVRWLENQLLTGKYMRTQKPNETVQARWDFSDDDKANNL